MAITSLYCGSSSTTHAWQTHGTGVAPTTNYMAAIERRRAQARRPAATTSTTITAATTNIANNTGLVKAMPSARIGDILSAPTSSGACPCDAAGADIKKMSGPNGQHAPPLLVFVVVRGVRRVFVRSLRRRRRRRSS